MVCYLWARHAIAVTLQLEVFHGLSALAPHPFPLLLNHRYPWVWATTWWNNAYGSCTPSGSCYLDAFRFDFAVVRLAEPVGQTRGYLALKYDNKMQGYSVTSAG